jgi:hypothetical protein
MSERYQVNRAEPGKWVITDTQTGRSVDWPSARESGLTEPKARALASSMNLIESRFGAASGGVQVRKKD